MAAADPPADSLPAPAPRRVCLLVALTAAALAYLPIFNNLGVPRMEPDEGYYALATDGFRAGGPLLSTYIHPDRPYFNKPPLYMWLSAATHDLLPGFELKYRAWSAAFGVLAVGLTAALGARLFRPAVGLVAGCMLATNRAFLFDHGARFGGMDAALTACFALVLLLYWSTRDAAAPRTWTWLAIGLVAGVAMMFKPLAGAPMLLLVGLHALVDRPLRGLSIGRHQFVAAAVAFGTATAVGAPWYLLQKWRFGELFTKKLFGEQLKDRVAGIGPPGEHKGWSFYFTEVPRASNTFLALLVPALIWLGFSIYRNAGRPAGEGRRGGPSAPALLLLLILGWVGALSLSSGKFLHYAYPVFPAITIAIAAMLADGVSRLGRRLPAWDLTGRRLNPAGASRAAVATLAAGFAVYVGYVAAVQVPREGSPLPAWSTYRLFAPAVAAGRMDLVFWDIAHAPADWPSEGSVRPNAMVYLSHMAGGTDVRDPAELSRRLDARRPTLVVYPRGADISQVPALQPSSGRVDLRYSMEQRTYSVAAVDVGPLMLSTLREGKTSPFLRLVEGGTAGPRPMAGPPAAFERKVAVEVVSPLPQPARLTFVVRPAAGGPARMVTGMVTGGLDVPPLRLAGVHRVSVVLEKDEMAKRDRRVVTLELTGDPKDGRGPVRAELIEVILEVSPPSPLGAKGPEVP